MKRLLILILVISFSNLHSQIGNFDKDAVWIIKDFKWHRPNNGVLELDTLGFGSFIKAIVFSDSVFMKIDCPVNTGNKMDSIQAERTPGNYFKGTWTILNDTVIKVTYRGTSADNPMDIHQDQIIIADNELLFQGEAYEVKMNLNQSSVRFLRSLTKMSYESLIGLDYR